MILLVHKVLVIPVEEDEASMKSTPHISLGDLVSARGDTGSDALDRVVLGRQLDEMKCGAIPPSFPE